jgi:hypothetical protein
MKLDRNLRFTMDLNDFPKFFRVPLWTLGISENVGTIRARAQIRSDTRKARDSEIPACRTGCRSIRMSLYFNASVYAGLN